MKNTTPLATRIRPTTLAAFFGQAHLVGENKPLNIAIKDKHLFSMIFWGPPGVGKTTLARIYASALDAEFHELSAVSAGKADVKAVIDTAQKTNKPTILFLDEIHRFNKAQQDFLLPYVEQGTLTLIGATTENPSFEVIAPLLSRCKVFILAELAQEDMLNILTHAATTLDKNLVLDEDPMLWLISMANGDARQAISMLENTYALYKKITVETLKETLQSKHLRYDKQGEEHYNTISAFIKSMRAGDANAAIYYLARMVDSGEDPVFIARRMVVFASEDIGLASTAALLVANQVFRACETIGYPECRINLAHGVVFLAQSKKDRRAYAALEMAMADVKKHGNLPIPLKIRNAPTKLMKEAGYGKDYKMYDTDSYLPDELKNKKYI